MAVMEWAFGSYRGQAEVVYAKIKEYRALARRLSGDGYGIWANIDVEYGPDPCEAG